MYVEELAGIGEASVRRGGRDGGESLALHKDGKRRGREGRPRVRARSTRGAYSARDAAARGPATIIKSLNGLH